MEPKAGWHGGCGTERAERDGGGEEEARRSWSHIERYL